MFLSFGAHHRMLGLLIASVVIPISVFAEVNAPTVEWRPVEARHAAGELHVTGRVIAGEGALKIESAGFTGRVMNILVREGDRIGKGTPLLEVSGAECIALAEEQRVAASHGLSDMIAAAKGRAEQLHLSLHSVSPSSSGECVFISAHEGTVIKRNAEIGIAFNAGDALVTLLDTRHLSAEFEVNERDLSLVRTGQKIHFQIAGDANETVESQITSIIPSIDAVTRVARIRAGAVHFSRPVLEAQLIGQISVPIQAQKQQGTADAFEVPPRSVVFAKNRRFVIKGTVEKPVAAEVRVLSEDANRAFIQPIKVSELKNGDVIAVTQALYLLKRAIAATVE